MSFRSVINLLLYGTQISSGKCDGLCHGAHYLHGDPLIQLADIKRRQNVFSQNAVQLQKEQR